MKKILAVASLSLLVHSLPCRAGDEHTLPPPVAAVATILQLSGDQIQALVTMIGTRDAAVQPLAEELQRHGQALQQLLQTPDADPAAVGKLLLEARALEAKISEVRRQAAAQFEQVLTPDQAERLQHIRYVAPLTDVVPAFRATGLV